MNRRLKEKLENHIVHMYVQEKIILTDNKKLSDQTENVIKQLYKNTLETEISSHY